MELGQPIQQNGSIDIALQYLEVSAFLKVHLGSGSIRLYIFAGPSYAAFLSGKEIDHYSLTFLNETGRSDTSYSINSDVKSYEISGVVGAGMEWKLPSGQLIYLDAGYSYGFTDVVEVFGEWAHSRDIRLAAGILFPFD